VSAGAIQEAIWLLALLPAFCRIGMYKNKRLSANMLVMKEELDVSLGIVPS